ncbi:MAG: regulatory protein GemA, partial [Treponema sp.]|nr:regulatory protein GemA [Treponema sp.]
MGIAKTETLPVLPNRKEKLSLIHVAKKETGITDEAYRLLLSGAAGTDSAAKIVYEDQFIAVMKAFEKLGFKSWKKRGLTDSRPDWPDAWGCTEDQRAKIEVMWKTCARNPSDRALRAFVKRIARVDSPVFLRPQLARKVILALADMMRRAGLDPETG